MPYSILLTATIGKEPEMLFAKTNMRDSTSGKVTFPKHVYYCYSYQVSGK